jgi:hypothetical protein
LASPKSPDRIFAPYNKIREKIFKNCAAKSIDEVCDMLVDGSLYIERNPELVKSMTSFPYIASSI